MSRQYEPELKTGEKLFNGLTPHFRATKFSRFAHAFNNSFNTYVMYGEANHGICFTASLKQFIIILNKLQMIYANNDVAYNCLLLTTLSIAYVMLKNM